MADELQPMVSRMRATISGRRQAIPTWIHRATSNGHKIFSEQDADYQVMFAESVGSFRDNFVARLLLMRRLIAAKQFDHATEQLPFLLQARLGNHQLRLG